MGTMFCWNMKILSYQYGEWHYDYVVMGAIASQITSLTIVYSTVCSDPDKKKHQSSASLTFVWGIHRRPVNSPHKWPVTRKMSPFDDVIMALWRHGGDKIVVSSHWALIIIWLKPYLDIRAFVGSWFLGKRFSGDYFNKNWCFIRLRPLIVEKRLYHDRFISTMAFLMRTRQHLYIETGPRMHSGMYRRNKSGKASPPTSARKSYISSPKHIIIIAVIIERIFVLVFNNHHFMYESGVLEMNQWNCC